MLGKLFKSIFSKTKQQADPVEHEGYFITPIMEDSGGHYNTRGKISKEINGELKEVMFIRADTHPSPDQAQEHSIIKAKQIIEEQGDKMFERTQI